MSNLPAQGGGLPVEFENFTSGDEKTFPVPVSGKYSFDVKSASHIAVLPSSENKVTVAIDADPTDLKRFDVRQQGDKILVHEKGSSGSYNGASINVSSFGGSIAIINGRIYVDGKEVRQGSQGSTKTPRILITAPATGGDTLDATMHGSAVLISAIPFNEAHIDLSGQNTAGVAAQNLDLHLSGQSKIKAISGGGELDIHVSGQGDTQVQGTYAKVQAELSGMGRIETIGEVKGDYTAHASGMGSIVHRGIIQGRIRESKSGMAKVSLG